MGLLLSLSKKLWANQVQFTNPKSNCFHYISYQVAISIKISQVGDRIKDTLLLKTYLSIV